MNQGDKERLRNFARCVGDFIRYWGFRRIHGEIWTVLYIFPRPVSGVELVDILEVSKALVSPALRELQDYGLIYPVLGASEDDRTRYFTAKEDVFSIIRSILKTREKTLLANALDSYLALKRGLSDHPDPSQVFDPDRFNQIEAMVRSAVHVLPTVIRLLHRDRFKLLSKLVLAIPRSKSQAPGP